MNDRLTQTELEREMERFGVPAAQVRRDHAISHLLAALSDAPDLADGLLFFGGTALGRTHLPDGRLSEDIDLIALNDRRTTVERLVRTVERGLLRSHGRVVWTVPFTRRDTEPAVLTLPDSITIRIQVLAHDGYEPWPRQWHDLEQRYSDAPPARLQVPALESFVAWKTVAWFDRRAPRDLWDLWALAEQDAITPAAAQLFVRHGPIGAPPQPHMFARPPTEDEWSRHLSHQTRLTVTAQEALLAVKTAWVNAVAAPHRPGSAVGAEVGRSGLGRGVPWANRAGLGAGSGG